MWPLKVGKNIFKFNRLSFPIHLEVEQFLVLAERKKNMKRGNGKWEGKIKNQHALSSKHSEVETQKYINGPIVDIKN